MSNGSGTAIAETRICPVCDKEFVPVVAHQKYDRERCGDVYRHRRRAARIREAVRLLDKFKARTGSVR